MFVNRGVGIELLYYVTNGSALFKSEIPMK